MEIINFCKWVTNLKCLPMSPLHNTKVYIKVKWQIKKKNARE